MLSFADLMRLILDVTGRERLLIPIPAGLLVLPAWFMEFLPEPPLTRDQLTMLGRDNVCGGELPGLADLGVQATALESILPGYLGRYRKGGQFAYR